MNALHCRPAGLNAAIEMVGMKFVGQQHSGIDDTNNTLLLAKHLNEQYGVNIICTVDVQL